MKLRNIFFLMLALSACPIMQISASATLHRTVSQAASSSFFKMNQTTQNILTGVGIGVGVISLGYLIWRLTQPTTKKVWADKIQKLNQDPLIGILLFIEEQEESLQKKLSEQLSAIADTGRREGYQWASLPDNFKDQRRQGTDFRTINNKQIGTEKAWLIRGVAILEDLIGQINSYSISFNNTYDTSLSDAQVDRTQEQIKNLKQLQNILDRVKGNNLKGIAADPRYATLQQNYVVVIREVEEAELKQAAIAAEQAKADAENRKAFAVIRAADLEAQGRIEAAKITAESNRQKTHQKQ